MNYHDILTKHYSKSIQLAPTHIEAVSSTITLRSPGCKLLIFGCGHDSAMWHELNKEGTTVFLESSAKWRDIVLQEHPELDIRIYEPIPMSIEDATTRPELLKSPPPAALQMHKWDVILVDGPPGYSPEQPGRAVVLSWVSHVRTRATHVFIDDYDRQLESFYADKFFKPLSVVQCPYRPGKRLAWSPGINDALMVGAKLGKRSATWNERKSAVIFLFDANYLLPFRVFFNSLRHAVETRKNMDLVVLTDDKDVYKDNFVNSSVDKVILIDENDLKKISRTQGGAVSDDVKHSIYNKYTFLKFFVFKDLGYKEHIFLDVDMICIDDNFTFRELIHEKKDFSAPPHDRP